MILLQQAAPQVPQVGALLGYWISMGVLLAQWLPICALMGYAMRLGLLSGLRAFEKEKERTGSLKAYGQHKEFEQAEDRRRTLAG